MIGPRNRRLPRLFAISEIQVQLQRRLSCLGTYTVIRCNTLPSQDGVLASFSASQRFCLEEVETGVICGKSENTPPYSDVDCLVPAIDFDSLVQKNHY